MQKLKFRSRPIRIQSIAQSILFQAISFLLHPLSHLRSTTVLLVPPHFASVASPDTSKSGAIRHLCLCLTI